MRSARAGSIKKSSVLGEIVSQYPELIDVLVNNYGLHCVGCYAAAWETLEEGAKAHGFEDKEIEKMVKKLNQIISKDKLTARAE